MKTIVTAFFTAFCTYFFTLASSIAQPEDFITRHYTMKDGLSTEYVFCVFQDSQGFLWMGTQGGLNKFDGYQFTTYRENASDPNSLSNNYIHSLWEDKQQRLWIGTITGLDIFDLKTEKFHHFLPDSLASSEESGINVYNIKERKDGKVWVCTNQGVYLVDPRTLSTKRTIYSPFEEGGNAFRDIAEARDGSLWAASERGLVHIDTSTGETTRYQYDPDDSLSLANDLIWTVYVDRHDSVWAGTAAGLDLFNPENQSFTHFLPEGLDKVQVHTFLEHPDGKFWTGLSSGLYSFNPETGKFDLLVDKYSWSLLESRGGSRWLGSGYGLFQILSESTKFNTYRQFGKTDNSLVLSLAEDTDHKIWLSSGSASLFKFDPSSRHFFQHLPDPANPRSFSGNAIAAIVPGQEGGVWLVSPGNLEKFNPQTQTFSSIALPIYPASKLPAMLQDSRGKIWIGEWGSIAVYDPQTKTYEQFPDFPKVTVHSFLEDQNENIWIGTIKGLFRYSLKTNQLDTIKNDPTDPQSLSNNRIYDLMMDKDGVIWIGTAGGLNKIIPGTEQEDPKFIHWQSTNSNLPLDDVYCIIDGGDGTFWMGCGNRISHFFPRTGGFRNYDHHDGLHGQSIGNFGKGLRSHNGEIYFGTIDGLVSFHPDSLQDNPYIPPVVITGFSIHNQAVPIQDNFDDTLSWKIPLACAIHYTNEVELTYQQNDFSLEFAALNFVNPESNLYKYKLEPYETEWIETDAKNRIARYTNLSPGAYTFRVIGSNNDGVWNEEGKSLSIIIHPPWWQTWWAYALYGLLALTALLSIRHYEMKRLKLRQRAKHLAEVDTLKTRFFANISHEFRTPLTLILGPLKDMYEGKFTGDRNAVFGVMIRNGQRLLNLINQLLDISKLEAGKMQLQATHIDMVMLLRHIASSYESIAIDKKIKYLFYPEMQELMLYADQEKVKKIVHNLLSNAFKFTPQGGEVIMYLKEEKNEWALISVKDTGPGIPTEELDKVFDRFYQVDSSQTRTHEGSGLGMALAKELVEIHHGKFTVESKEGKGTTFTVWLPMGKAHLRKEEIRDIGEVVVGEKVVVDVPGEQKISEEATGIVNENTPLILVVDDNADMRQYINSSLGSQYQIREAENGKEGTMLAKELLPDLIISDVMMPQMDGYELCENIKTHESTSHIPVVLLTARADHKSKMTGLETGADDYLSKPFDAEELHLIIRNRIEERRIMREKFSKDITLEPRHIPVSSLDEQFLQKVMRIIEVYMADENFTIEALSREAGYSHAQFYRKLKALTDQTPSQFLRKIRLKRAAELLQQKSDSVSQIAYHVGFSSLPYFNKCFKDEFGMTPGQFVVESQEVKKPLPDT